MHFLIVGVGSIGERHLRNLLRIDGIACSIAEINAGMREKIAAEYTVQQAYTDYRDADLSAFDAVVICVPANLHIPIATDVVAAGTHVLTEKPLAMSFDGVDELKRLRDEKGVVVSVAFTLRSDPLMRELKELIDTTSLGKVRLVNYYAGQYWPMGRKDFPPVYAQDRTTGGGAIPDHLVHMINFMEWSFGPVDKVAAKHWRLSLTEVATEDTAFVTMQFTNSVIVQLGLCVFQHGNYQRLHLAAEKGTCQLRDECDTLEFLDAEHCKWRPGEAQRIDRDDVFVLQAKHFMECIKGNATPRCTVEQGEQTLRTVSAAIESADGDGQFVKA